MKLSNPILFAVVLSSVTGACSTKNQSQNAVVSNVITQTTGLKPSVAPGTGGTQTGLIGSIQTSQLPAITAKITINKEALFGQTYFYGADLQYSSIYDKNFDLYNQSSAFGHIPAVFRRNGSEVQLVADNKRLFPSDVNHPERLISRYSVLEETADTITLSEANSAEFLVTTLDPTLDSPRDHWARSFEFIRKGNYLLQESSVVLKDGTIAEVMETVFPSVNLKPSADFKIFEMDPNDPVGAQDGVVARYRMLPGEAIFSGKSDPVDGELKVAFAQHFDIGENKTIDWYVTSNIKDEQLDVVKQAVEGWNRYFKSYNGIAREVLKFKGRLPNGVKIGDPRYNVINWDSRLIAGAAYESQANDPFTGNQSHSVIYMPVAWFTIGMKYWSTGQYSDKEVSAKDLSTMSNLLKKSCIRDVRGAAQALNSGRMTGQEAEVFSKQLMKQTLFHEVGHALGLAHNFKGSLTFDRKDPKSLFSSSIMDYNDYEIERQAFPSIDSSDGPMLEYDRQALSAIYNQSKDVKDADPVMPACNDAEADTDATGAVDPLCIRYDIEKDPTESVNTALSRLKESSLTGDVSLVQAFQNVKTTVLSEAALKAAVDQDGQIVLAQTFVSSIYGVMRFYLMGGKASLGTVVKRNIKSLYIFEKDVLPSSYNEKEMRDRAFAGVVAVLSMKELSDPVKAEIGKLAEEGSALLMKSTYATANVQASTVLSGKVKEGVRALSIRVTKDSTDGLVKLRNNIIDATTRIPTLPLYFGSVQSAGSVTAYDFETSIAAMLFEISMDISKSPGERLHAARALASYAGRPSASDLLSRLKMESELELKAASNNRDREFALALIGIIK